MPVGVQPEKIQVPVQCHDGEEDKMEGLADPKVDPWLPPGLSENPLVQLAATVAG